MGSERASVVEGGEPAASAAAGVNVWGERCAQWCPMVSKGRLTKIGKQKHIESEKLGILFFQKK